MVSNETTISGSNFTEAVSAEATKRCQIRPPQPITLGVAFGNFFAWRAKYPPFKKRGVRDSFKLSSGQFAVQGKSIRIASVGWVRMLEAVRFAGANSFR